MMNCERVRDEIKAYIDGELGSVARLHVSRHLATCADCRMEEKTMTDLTEQVQNADRRTAPEGMREKVLGMFDFQPAPREVDRRVALRRRLIEAMTILTIVAVTAAIISPVFQKARESSRMSSARDNVRAIGTFAEPKASAPSSAPMPAAAPVPKAKMPADAIEIADVAPSKIDTAFTPMIIKMADLTIEVKDFQRAYDRVVSISKGAGGFVTNSSAAATETDPSSGGLTVRVPSDAFERVMTRLSELGVVKSRNVSGEDVTGEVVDLQSRLRNKRAEEKQYLEIMNRAKRIVDIVTVTGELSRVRGEIEEMEGRLKYLKSAAAMSTITVNLSENEKSRPVPKSSIERTFGSAVAALARAGNALAALVIWLAVFSPFWALPLGVGFYVHKRRMREV